MAYGKGWLGPVWLDLAARLMTIAPNSLACSSGVISIRSASSGVV